MNNFTTVTRDKVTIKHHSTSSIIEIVVADDDPKHEPQVIWLDYYELDSLSSCIKCIEDE